MSWADGRVHLHFCDSQFGDGPVHLPRMLTLADYVLSIDGEKIPLSRPLPIELSSAGNVRLRFGISAQDAEKLEPHRGKVGFLSTQSGVVLTRMRVREVDGKMNVVTGIPARADEV